MSRPFMTLDARSTSDDIAAFFVEVRLARRQSAAGETRAADRRDAVDQTPDPGGLLVADPTFRFVFNLRADGRMSADWSALRALARQFVARAWAAGWQRTCQMAAALVASFDAGYAAGFEAGTAVGRRAAS